MSDYDDVPVCQSDVTTAEVIVVGLGPGGEQVILDLVREGVDVIGIEAQMVGGECPYWGCIPSKMALRAATTLTEAAHVNELAGKAEVAPNWAPVAKRIREKATDYWNDKVAVDRILEGGGIVVKGRGVITGSRTVEVMGTQYTATRALVIATGTVAALPPVEGLADIDFWTNRGALHTETVPDSLIVLGGGAIGCELAQVFARFGAEVTIVEFAPRLLALEEPEVGEILKNVFEADGIKVLTGVGATKVSGSKQINVELSDGSSISASQLLIATGRKIVLAELGADSIGAGPDNGHTRFLPTNDFMRVTVEGEPIEGVFAVGDVAGKGAFTHVATLQGRMVADQILGRETIGWSKRVTGHVTFTDPEIGSVGLSEASAREQGYDVVVATYPMESVSRAFIHGAGNEGILKIVVDRASKCIIGATVAGPHAGEVLSGLTVAVAGAVPLENLITTGWAFPTYHRGYDSVLAALPEDLRPIR